MIRWMYGTFGALLLILSAACTAQAVPTGIPIVPTIAPITANAVYWDAGIRLSYPQNWAAPFYGSGQMLIVPSAADAQRQPPINPLVEVQISTLAQLNLRKEATLSEIASLVSHQSSAYTQQGASSATTFAGLDAVGLTLIDTPDRLLQQTVTFRLPDGRIGWLLGLGPLDTWADFSPTFDNMRASAVLLSPSQYPAVGLSPDVIQFVPGKINFRLPATWVGATGKSGAALYHGAQDTLYQDGSGFANGPQMVIQARPMVKGQNAAFNLIVIIGAGTTPPESITVGSAGSSGGVRTAARVVVSDPATQQRIVFVAVPSADQTTLSIFRWTNPLALTGVTQPVLDSILQSITFGADASALPTF